MSNRLTARGIVRGSKTIEVQDERLDDWLDQEVIVTIKRKTDVVAAVEEMVAQMREGDDIGYERIERDRRYRV